MSECSWVCLYQEDPLSIRSPQSTAEWKENLIGQTLKNNSLVQEELQVFINIKTHSDTQTQEISQLQISPKNSS